MTRNEALRAELLRIATHPDDPTSADRLWEFLDDYEMWPGIRLVGVDGEHAAWIVAQLGDPGLQRRCLEHLEVAVDCGDADPAHYATLVDRVRMADGRPQVYGSQFVVRAQAPETGDAGTGDTDAGDTDAGDVEPWPIEDPIGVDERRRQMHLSPLAIQRQLMQECYRERGLTT